MLEQAIQRNCPPMAPLPTGIEAQLNRLAGVKAVLFDVYGTLFVSGSGDVGTASATDSAQALAEALAAAGFEGDLAQVGRDGKPLLKAEILKQHQAGHEAGIEFPEVEICEIWPSLIETLLGTPATPEQIQRLAVEYECRVNPVFPMPGSREALQKLKADGRVLGIVSNAQFYTPLLFPAFFGQTVAACGFDPEGCIWSFQEREAKPSPALFQKAGEFLRKKYGIQPRETAYIGNDMLNDIYCAQQAGCRTVLFAGDRRSLRLRENDARCATLQPDAVITTLSQLEQIL